MAELEGMTDDQITASIKEMESQIRREKNEFTNAKKKTDELNRRLKENREKLKLNTQLPHMVANVGEILEPEVEDEGDHDGSGFDVKKTGGDKTDEKKQKALVIKTTGRHTVYLPVPGMVEAEDLKPGELIAVNKESFIVYEKLPAEYDSRVMAMEVDERPTEDYTDIGGLDKQIEELTEAIVLPMTHPERFKNIGIRPPKGLLMHGPPGTGKTLMARACAA
jgi:26S proteasome regulatory subunit T5